MKINTKVEDDVVIVTVKLNPLEDLMLYLPWVGDWIARCLVRKIRQISEKESKAVIVEWGG